MKSNGFNELISIIVPIYNVEKYLGRCVDSLINQTYTNIEIILVDDGSPDNCPQLCDELAKTDDRIVVLHKPNGGLSDARNAGIAVAKGDFIGFVDSDDYISTDMYERLYSYISKTDADIAMCRYRRFSGEKCTDLTDSSTGKYIELSTSDTLTNMYGMEGEIYTVAWNKLYKRSAIGDIRYPVKKLNEDEFTTYKFMANAKKIVFTDDVLYYYFYNNNSITTNKNYLSNHDIYEALDERNKYLENKGFSNIEPLTQKLYLDRIVTRSRNLYKSDKNAALELHKIYVDRYNKVKNMVPGIGYKIYKISPQLYYFLLNIKSK